MKDPYSEMMNIFKETASQCNTLPIQLGEIISVDPLAVKTGNLQLNSYNLLVADYLLKGYKRTLKLEESEKIYEAQDTFNINDEVALIQLDSATFIILARVVRA